MKEHLKAYIIGFIITNPFSTEKEIKQSIVNHTIYSEKDFGFMFNTLKRLNNLKREQKKINGRLIYHYYFLII